MFWQTCLFSWSSKTAVTFEPTMWFQNPLGLSKTVLYSLLYDSLHNPYQLGHGYLPREGGRGFTDEQKQTHLDIATYILNWPKDPQLHMRISFVLLLLLHHARTTPPEIWKGLDWRALVGSCPPNIGKLRGYYFFPRKKKTVFKNFRFFEEKNLFLRFFQIFWHLTIFHNISSISRPMRIEAPML